MGSDSKGGTGAKNYDYYGTVVGAVCVGPVDTLEAVIVDGRTIVTGPVSLSTDATDLALDPTREKYLDKTGRLTIYRGTQTQAVDADLEPFGHSAYRGICYLVAVGLLFGRERQEAPNIQVVVGRKPRCSTSIVAGADNTVDPDGQVNPVAALAELVTSDFGLGIPEAMLDATSWLAAGAWAADPLRSMHCFCSPYFASQSDARKAIGSLLEMIDATLFWTPDGKLAVALIKPGVTPVGVATIDSRHITERHRLDSPGWPSVPTSVAVTYRDREAQFKSRVQRVESLLAFAQRSGIRKENGTERAHVTGANQAAEHAAELARRSGQPVGEIELTVRRGVARALALHPGSKVQVDIDAEPGGTGLAQLCVVEEVRTPSVGGVKLRVRPDTLVDAVPYSPSWVPPVPQAADCPPIDETKCVVLPLPPRQFGEASIAILAPRPTEKVVGFRVFFGPDPDEAFADLGTQQGFAARAALKASTTFDSTDDDVILTLPEGETGPDGYLAERFPGTNIDADQDKLLLILANLDANGRVVITDGAPEMEFCSIIARFLSGSDMVYVCSRSRLGTVARDWDDTASAWIVPGESLVAWTHDSIGGLLSTGGVGYVRLVAFSAEAEDDTTPIPERTFQMPESFIETPRISWTAPANSIAAADGSGNFSAVFRVRDGNGDLVSVKTQLVRVADGASVAYQETTWPGTNDTGDVTRALTGLAAGTYDFVVTASDRAGHITQDRRQIFRAAASGGGAIRPPKFDPPTRNPWRYTIVPGGTPFKPTLTISVTGSATGFEFWGEHLDSGYLAIPLTTISSTSFTFGLTGYNLRVRARATDGTVWSDWSVADYVFERE